MPSCRICLAPIDVTRSRGEERRYCEACRVAGNALSTLLRQIDGRPEALVGVVEALSERGPDKSGLTTEQVRRLRSAAMRLGNGKRLDPGSTQRFQGWSGGRRGKVAP